MKKISIVDECQNFEVNLLELEEKNYQEKIAIFKEFDKILQEINKSKYQNNNDILEYIKSLKPPLILDFQKARLVTLLDYFQKRFVFKSIELYFNDIKIQLNQQELNRVTINCRPNNFSHLLGVAGQRDNNGIIKCRAKPKEFLDGVMHQWILFENSDKYSMNLEKAETLSWMKSTLLFPTYIFSQDAIKKQNTKFYADIIFVKQITSCKKYSFHVIGLKQEKQGTFVISSQFPIQKERYNRINVMFDTKKAIYDFFKKGGKTPISSGLAGSIYQGR